jgi:protein phosphatase
MPAVDQAQAVTPEAKPTDAELDIYGLSHRGLVRDQNEDHFLICSLRRQIDIFMTNLPEPDWPTAKGERLAFLAMVADGVGGRAAGEEASKLAVQRVTQYVSRSLNCFYTVDADNERAFRDTLQQAALETHALIRSAADQSGMATTLTLWLGIWPHGYLLQVGDSRCYQLRDGVLNQLSRDQTMAAELIRLGVIKPTDPGAAKHSHVLTSALGGREAEPLVTSMEQHWGDVGLLCSDGLTRHVSDVGIRNRLLNMTSAKQACEALLQDALDGGGSDNITILIGRTIPKR